MPVNANIRSSLYAIMLTDTQAHNGPDKICNFNAGDVYTCKPTTNPGEYTVSANITYTSGTEEFTLTVKHNVDAIILEPIKQRLPINYENIARRLVADHVYIENALENSIQRNTIHLFLELPKLCEDAYNSPNDYNTLKLALYLVSKRPLFQGTPLELYENAHRFTLSDQTKNAIYKILHKYFSES